MSALPGTSSAVRFSSWLGHDDDNKVTTLYDADHETAKQEANYLAKLIRRGTWVREITDEEKARFVWTKTLTEPELRALTAPPVYDPDSDGSAASIAERLVAYRRGERDAF